VLPEGIVSFPGLDSPNFFKKKFSQLLRQSVFAKHSEEEFLENLRRKSEKKILMKFVSCFR
jgi:hypothetical protein